MSPLGSGGSELNSDGIRGQEPGKAWPHACPASPAKRLVTEGNYKAVHHGECENHHGRARPKSKAM